MLKVQTILIAILIASVTFVSCTRIQQVLGVDTAESEPVEMGEIPSSGADTLLNALMITGATLVSGPPPEPSSSLTAPRIEGGVPEMIAASGSTVSLPFEYSGTNNLAGCIVYVDGVDAYYQIPYTGAPEDLPSAIAIGLPEDSGVEFIEVCYGVYDDQGQTGNFIMTVIRIQEVPMTVPLEGILQNDEFDDSAQGLQPFWHVQNGDKSPYMLSSGSLVVEGGFWQNLWSEDSSTRFYQVTNQERFTVETSMVFDHRDVSSVAGLVISSPTTQDGQGRDGEWITLKLWGHGAADENGNIGNIFEGQDAAGPGSPHTTFLQYQRRSGGLAPDFPGYNPPAGNIPIAMRLERNGDTYEAWFKPNAQGDWMSVGRTTLVLSGPVEVGLFVGISQPEAPGGLTVSFDYFRVSSTE